MHIFNSKCRLSKSTLVKSTEFASDVFARGPRLNPPCSSRRQPPPFAWVVAEHRVHLPSAVCRCAQWVFAADSCLLMLIFAIGGVFSSIFSRLFGSKEYKVLILGLDSAGKTTILFKLQLGEVFTTAPTIGFNVETVQFKNIKLQGTKSDICAQTNFICRFER